MIVEMGKEYRLKNGDYYRLLCVDAGGTAPVVGLVYYNSGLVTYRHRLNGTSSVNPDFDLVEVKPRIKGEFWVVHFLGGPSCKTFQTQQEAQMWAGASKNVIAITHHTYDGEEGEGLK